MAVMTVARLGVARLGAFRLNAFVQPSNPTIKGAAWVKILINGVDCSAKTFIDGVSITDELNHQPNTARFRVRGFTPVVGHEVKIYLADTDVTHQLFGGHILSLEQGFEGKPAAPNVYWECSCIDYTWLLNRRPIIKKYSSQSATAIVLDLMASFASGITTAHVTTGLASLDEITFTNEDLPDALTRITERIGGYWYVDYGKDLHVFLTEVADAVTVADGSKTASQVRRSADVSQVATRVVARGGGSNTAADIAVGQTTLPLVDAADTWYASGGGVAECGPQRITYTGKASTTETGSKVTPFLTDPASALIASQTFGFSFPNLWSGFWAFSFVNAVGEESALGLSVSGLYTNNSGGTVDYSLTSIDVGPSGTTQRKVYRTKNGGAGGFFLLTTLNDNSTTSYTDNTVDGSLGAATAPTVNNTSTPAGATTLPVADTAQFLSGGGWGEAPGGQIFRYTGRSVSSGVGTLTGVPASGVGSLTAAVGTGTIKTVPHLTGVTGVLYTINKGEAVNLIVTVNDTTAQTAMASYLGTGDGIHEMFLTDGRWSITEATARANAELSQRKDPLVTTHLVSRDQTIKSGRSITFSMTNPAITGTAQVQRVTISQIGIFGQDSYTLPLRTVECSSRMYSVEDLLRQIRKVA